MEIPATQVKVLRDRTGCGFIDCKEALQQCAGDVEKAVILLRQKGAAVAAKKSARTTSEGQIGTYLHLGGKIGVMVEMCCETDFVARSDDFQLFLKDLCLQVCASRPVAVRREDIPAELVAREREVYLGQAAATGKPPAVQEKMVQGKLEKYYAENCLLEQPFVRDPGKKVQGMLNELIGKLKENLVVVRFVRFEVGGA